MFPRIEKHCAFWLLSTLTVAGVFFFSSGTVQSQEISRELAAKLTPAQKRSYVEYLKARSAFEAQLDAYWIKVKGKRQMRAEKRRSGRTYAADDYIAAQPPTYTGPELTVEIAKIVAETAPPALVRQLPTVAEFLSHAKSEYGFVPAPVSEREFKRNYAHEALAVGLTPDQVVQRLRRASPKSGERRSLPPLPGSTRMLLAGAAQYAAGDERTLTSWMSTV